MKHYRVHLILIAGMVCVLWFSGYVSRPLHQELVTADIDLAAAGGNLFVVQGDTLKKLDAELQVLKTVKLPLPAPFLPPEPPSDTPAPLLPQTQDDKELYTESSALLPVSTASGRISADQQHVYVFYEGTLMLFDHDLTHIQSAIID